MIAPSSFWVLPHPRPRRGSPWMQREQGDPSGHFECAPQAHRGLSTLPLLLPRDCTESIGSVWGYWVPTTEEPVAWCSAGNLAQEPHLGLRPPRCHASWLATAPGAQFQNRGAFRGQMQP